MNKLAFISYASDDRSIALKICSLLENNGIPCWIAPRDVVPGKDYAAEIVRGIASSNAFLLILSTSANNSAFVKREVERAVSKGKTIFTVRIENVLPSQALELFISSAHWIDAREAEFDRSVLDLAASIHTMNSTDSFSPPTHPSKPEISLLQRIKISKPFIVILGICFVIGLLASGLYFFAKGQVYDEANSTADPTNLQANNAATESAAPPVTSIKSPEVAGLEDSQSMSKVADSIEKTGESVVDKTLLGSSPFLELEVADISYVPPVKGFMFRNSVGLEIAREDSSTLAAIPLEEGSKNNKAVITWEPDQELELSILEYGWSTHALTNSKLLRSDTLTGTRAYEFRILNEVFRDNPELDTKKRQISLTLIGRPFDPDAASGPDREESGAQLVDNRSSYSCDVSFNDQNATNHLKFVGSNKQCKGVVWLKSKDGIEMTVLMHSKSTKPKLISYLGAGGIWEVPCEKKDSVVIRLRALVPGSDAVCWSRVWEPEIGDKVLFDLLGTLSSENLTTASDGPETQSQTQSLRDVVPALRRELQVSAEEMIGYFDEEIKAHRYEPVMKLLDSELDEYARASKSCCGQAQSVQQAIAIIRAEKGGHFDKVQIEKAIQSEYDGLALRAVDAIDSSNDARYIEDALTKLLRDKRDFIAQAARTALIKRDENAVDKMTSD